MLFKFCYHLIIFLPKWGHVVGCVPVSRNLHSISISMSAFHFIRVYPTPSKSITNHLSLIFVSV